LAKLQEKISLTCGLTATFGCWEWRPQWCILYTDSKHTHAHESFNGSCPTR